MAIVIRPKDEVERSYLDCLIEVVRRKGIRGGRVRNDVYIDLMGVKFLVKEGDYVIFYDNKPKTVEDIGKALKGMGYEVGFFDYLTVSTLKYFTKTLQNLNQD
ncbi:MAG: hypothetical protein QXG39_00540 [Candidatus Aenigmatarchaeota archaeon]